MALPMTRPTKHPKTGIYRLRKSVPAALRIAAGKREWVVGLGTKDLRVARERAPAALRQIETLHQAARAASQPPRHVSLREVMALCGERYRDLMADWEDDPGEPSSLDMWAATIRDRLEEDDDGTPQVVPTALDTASAKRFLTERGIAGDEASIRRFAIALLETEHAAALKLRERAEGDYSPDPNLVAFPPLPTKADAHKPLTGDVLLARWAKERHPSAATLKAYGSKLRTLAAILGFDDIRRITRNDVVTFKQARLDANVNAGTVEDDIRMGSTLAKWAVANGLLKDNPFAGLAPKAISRGPAPRAKYDDADAALILNAARKEQGWLRWAAWMLCFTGARVGEIEGLRACDVRQEGSTWIFDFHPLQGREGKNATFQRMTPIHPTLIAEGFLRYVATRPKSADAPLFPGKALAASLRRWVRLKVGITDTRKDPAHAWRHRMEDELRKIRALPEVQDAITGRNNPRNAGAGYGDGFRRLPADVLEDLRRMPLPAGVIQAA
jgi:integrase